MMKGRQIADGDLQLDFQALGFSDHEARAYLALYRLQPATAYEVSKLAALPKANAYSVLESLSKKEARSPSRNRRCVTSPWRRIYFLSVLPTPQASVAQN